MVNQMANVDIAMQVDHNIDDLFAFLRGGKTFEFQNWIWMLLNKTLVTYPTKDCSITTGFSQDTPSLFQLTIKTLYRACLVFVYIHIQMIS